ncbi:MAG: polysaccharide biosynthesis C-terminal domain-containing protein, partial [Bacteroides sp.]|nr:polysaccharide biosynthesis C-terminal domain-containing protein [Bacteroides sp.]
PRVQLGIYGAASKVALILAMFTQAFRYAYEPFVFGKSNETDNRQTYADAMKYFIIFSLLAFLVVICYLDILRYLISPDYWEGLKVVPIVMGAEIFIGIYFNLSFWYKLIDETKWGAYFSLAGCIIIILLNILFVSRYGYVASACAGLIGYFIITLLSYIVGQKKYPIQYDFKTIDLYFLLTILLYTAILLVPIENIWLRLLYRSLILFLYLFYMIRHDFPLSSIPYMNRFLKKNKP